ncbi:MAG: hypothetical protein FWD40_07865 [Treponema sp.]|nr:hypothetical protein [Treponema sp.]
MAVNEADKIAQDALMELDLAHTQSQDDIASSIPNSSKLKALRSKIALTKAAKSAIIPFLGSVELDLERQKPIGIKELFTLWLENGNKYWLNPMDKSNGLGVLEEILFKYQGGTQALQPFVQLLVQLAKNNISPRAFAEYVILPRMRQDYNWRRWKDNHLESLQIIAQLLTAAKEHPPFNQEHIGSGRTKLARDIVLVRYIGRPLSQYQAAQLRDEEKLANYRQTWQKISLQNPLSLYFMRNNALHFIYIMSGKIDLVQLVAIVEQLPDIERAFTKTFPDANINIKSIKAMFLYDYDIDHAIQARKNSGFHSLDFAVEIKAYFSIVKALLQKATGVYLCAYYARLLKRFKNPVIAEFMNKLVRIIDDRGGMHIYKWHTQKLLGITKINMHKYIQFIEENRGCDPQYPRLHLIFRDEDAARETRDVHNLVNNFGLSDAFLKNKTSVSYRDLLNAYMSEYPETKDVIEKYQNNFLCGSDRQWTKEYIQKLDLLGVSGERSLHGPLLRSVIRGIGCGWSMSKSFCFAQLFEEYGSVHSSFFVNARTSFQMPIIQIGQNDAEKDKFARKRINLVNIEKVWNALYTTEQVNVYNTISFINSWAMDLNEPLDKAYERKLSYENELKELQTADKEIIKKLEKDIAKQDKTINALQEKKQHYSKIIEKFDSLNDLQKFITALILAGTKDKLSQSRSEKSAGHDETDDNKRPIEDFSGFAGALLLQRYKHLESITSRFSFLKDDVSVDVISYQQLIYLLNLLETLFFELREDGEIAKLLLEDTVLQEILEQYIITKKKEITMDALDAAAKKITAFASLQAERAKWQGILASMEEKDEKYYHNMEIYTSKTFMDSHYGDMGGICLSTQPGQILRTGFFVQRLADLTDRQIIGMSVLYLSTSGFSSNEVQAVNYWHAFAFNPLFSFLRNCTEEQALFLYLQFRLNLEKIARMTKLPVVISGIESKGGLISNSGHFDNLIRKYELGKSTAMKVYNARGFSVYYSQQEFAKALVIIDPRGYEDVEELGDIPTFHAHAFFKKDG